jgi:long-chain acyl-CoA synthetase
MTIIDLIDSFETRNKIALKYRTDFRVFVWDYKKLYSYILRSAKYLQKRGVKKGDKVILWGPNSPEWLIAFFGAIYLGTVVVPIDLKSTIGNVKKIQESSEAKFAFKTKFKPELEIDTIYLEELIHDLKNCEEIEKRSIPNEDDTVELVYTSGTTGDPKGVVITHKNLVSNFEAGRRRIDLLENDRMLSVLPLSHLFEQTGDMLAPISAGAMICYLSAIKPSAIFAALKEEDITIFVSVPRLLQGIIRKISKKFNSTLKKKLFMALISISKKLSPRARKALWFFVHKKFGKSFRFLVSGGSALDPDTADFWDLLGFDVSEGYGLTECSPILTIKEPGSVVKKSVGKALDNVELKIGNDGEILAKGPNVFSGYYNNEEKTKEVFRDGWFRTGDIGEIDADGNLYIKGRKKDVIITAAGINAYPDDIEDVLNEIPGVKESAVIGISDSGNEEVHAVLILDDDDLDADMIISTANERLDSSQKILGWSLWQGEEFPKTTTLKIKKNIVREKIKESDKKEVHAIEHGKIEKLILEIIPDRGAVIHDDLLLYSDLKLDSIGRVELVSAIEREFDVDFEEELINEKTTVGKLKEHINERKVSGKKSSNIIWNYSWPMKMLRGFLLNLFGVNFIRIWCRIEARGTDNLKKITGPVIFAPNHLSYLDQTVVLAGMPKGMRYNVATAAREEYFRPDKKNVFAYYSKRAFFYFLATAYGIFSLSQKNNFKENLQFIGKLMDRGEHIILFPEGERSRTGEMLPLKKGIAILARDLQIPVVPVRITGTDNILHRDWALPKRGKAIVSFGEPISFGNESQEEILRIIKEGIERL